MRKFTLTLFLLLTSLMSAFSQTTTTLGALTSADIAFWTGTGSNEAILVVDWNYDNAAYAWGFRWNDADFSNGIVVSDMMTAIDDNDADLTIDGTSFVNDFIYNNGTTTYTANNNPNYGYFLYAVNNAMADYGVQDMPLAAGDVVYWQYGSDWPMVIDQNLTVTIVAAPNTPTGNYITNVTKTGDLNVFPSIAKSGETITVALKSSNAQTATRLEVYNVSGKCIAQYEAAQWPMTLTIAEKGLHLLRAVSADGTVVNAKAVVY